MKRFECALFMGLVCSILFSMGSFSRDCDYLRENVLRVHILANSNAAEDQSLKLRVRDAILSHSAELFGEASTLQEAEALLAQKLELVEEIANEALSSAGSQDTADAQLVNMYFDTRYYGGKEYPRAFDMPAGRYDALRVTIGDGQGKNWWCVAYPPMCIDAARAEGCEDTEQAILSLQQTVAYRPKLAIVEFFTSIKEKISKEKTVNLLTDEVLLG